MSDTPVEVQFTSAGCLNYPCRTPDDLRFIYGHLALLKAEAPISMDQTKRAMQIADKLTAAANAPPPAPHMQGRSAVKPHRRAGMRRTAAVAGLDRTAVEVLDRGMKAAFLDEQERKRKAAAKPSKALTRRKRQP
jgi:hypothetical protein